MSANTDPELARMGALLLSETGTNPDGSIASADLPSIPVGERLLVVGICGHNRSGKDTAALGLSLNGFRRIALADGVREAYASLDGLTWELRKEGENAREALKLLGTECREAIGATHHWVDLLLIKIAYLNRYRPERFSRFVVPDIRFPHEPTAISRVIKSWGGHFMLWRIERPGCVPTSSHGSETLVDSLKVDLTIRNTGTREDLVYLASRQAKELFDAM